jgi:hypothetical protein
MGKTKRSKKKKFKKKVNPEQSNKMIYAVVAGLAILIIVFLFFTIRSDTVVDKNELMTKTLKYLKRTDGIKELKILPKENRVIIIHDRITEQNKNLDFPKIALYAGIKCSYEMGEEELTVLLCEYNEKNKVYSVVLKDGRIVSEKLLK